MGNIYVNTCANGTDSQTWQVLGDGRIALAPTAKSVSVPCPLSSMTLR
jgi:hypothetical protein